MCSSDLKKEQLKNVITLGIIPRTQIPTYLELADILVIPHTKCLQNNLDLPTKLFEYFEAGKPVVSSNLKAIVDVAEGAVVFVDPDDPQSLAEGINKVLKDKKLAKRLGVNGKKLVEKYSVEKSVMAMYAAYKTLEN